MTDSLTTNTLMGEIKGAYKNVPLQVNGESFEDLNGNGVIDSGEALQNIGVNLINSKGITIGTGITTATGIYMFSFPTNTDTYILQFATLSGYQAIAKTLIPYNGGSMINAGTFKTDAIVLGNSTGDIQNMNAGYKGIIIAMNDTVNLKKGESATMGILQNDILYTGYFANLSTVILQLSGAIQSGITLSGYTLQIANTLPVNTYIVPYKICEVRNATNCATATATIIVSSPTPPPSGTGFAGGGGSGTGNGGDGGSGGPTPTNISNTIFNETVGAKYFTVLDEKIIDQSGVVVTELFKKAHQMLYSYELTKWNGTKDFRPYAYLTREQAARFTVEFAKNVLCRQANTTYTNQFTDLDKADPTLVQYIEEAYAYSIFHGDKGGVSSSATTFRPKDLITEDEVAAIMVRLVRNAYFPENQGDRASLYRVYLERYTPESSLGTLTRANVAEVIYDLYRNNKYTFKEAGCVIVD